MKDSLKNTQRDIFFANNTPEDNNKKQLGRNIANSWRTAKDLNDNWNNMLNIIYVNNKWQSKPDIYGWNDPGMLKIRNGGMTIDEYKAYFGLWALSKVPLMFGLIRLDIKDIEKKIPMKNNHYELKPAKVGAAVCNGLKEQKWENIQTKIKQSNKNLCLEVPKFAIDTEINNLEIT